MIRFIIKQLTQNTPGRRLEFAVLAIVFFMLSCNQKQKAPVLAKAVPTRKPQGLIVRQGDHFKIVDSNSEKEILFGPDGPWPDQIPRDFPVPESCQFNNQLQTGEDLFLTFSTERSLEEIRSYYLDSPALKNQGWVEDSSEVAKDAVILNIHKKNQKYLISLARRRDSTGSFVSIYLATP